MEAAELLQQQAAWRQQQRDAEARLAQAQEAVQQREEVVGQLEVRTMASHVSAA